MILSPIFNSLLCQMGYCISLLMAPPNWGEICQEAYEKLLAGNQRYVNDQLQHPDRTSERREALIGKQKPFAAVLSCSDSRVAPEILFDQGLGDLFVVRVAGNVVGPIELDSLDYATLHLGACLILVLGHENCGAIKAVLDHQTQDIEAVAKQIEPAIHTLQNNQHNSLESAVKANVHYVVEYLKQTSTISHLMADKKVAVVGGYYHLNTGKVEILNGQ